MPVSVSHIVQALADLGGEAHLDAIERRVREIAPPPIPEAVGAIVRGRLQNYCSGTRSYTHKLDLFESVHGVEARRGVWRLRSQPLTEEDAESVLDGVEPFLEASEGRAKLRLHLIRERSKKLIRAFKASLSDLRCQGCGFDFERTYGELGRGYIEAHHTKPVASLGENEKTSLIDLVALCANCHRMVHLNGLISLDVLKASIGGRLPPD